MRKWTRAQLVDYMKVRDFASSELKKAQLLHLALKVQELNVPLIEEDDTFKTAIEDFARLKIMSSICPKNGQMIFRACHQLKWPMFSCILVLQVAHGQAEKSQER